MANITIIVATIVKNISPLLPLTISQRVWANLY